jgi:membrane fusion protein, multidrug efflux system
MNSHDQHARTIQRTDGRRRARYARYARVAAAVALLALAAACDSAAEGPGFPPPPEVSVAEVLLHDVQHWDEFTGRIEPVESVELTPRVTGYIEKLNFAEGGEVNQGDVLFVIDQRSYRAALARAEAELARARSRIELARSEQKRAAELAEARAISAEELEQKTAALAQAEADVQAAHAAVDVARLELEFTEVRAPVSGRVGRAYLTVGNLARADATLLTTIVSLDPVHVYFDSDERTYLRYLEMERNGERRNGGNPVQVALADEENFPHQGKLDFIDNHVDAATGTIRARARLSNPDGRFTPGLFVRVRLLGSNTYRALLVDDKAILTDQDRKYVYVVGEDGLAQRRDVRTGRKVEGLRVVETGLAAGDRVIVHGVQKVFFPGMPVQARQIAMGDSPMGDSPTAPDPEI